MKKLKHGLQLTRLFLLTVVGILMLIPAKMTYAAPCPGGSFLGLPPWFKYLEGRAVTDEATGFETCVPMLQNGLNDIWKVVAAVIELLLRVSSLVAIGFIVFGGVTYILSQGASDKTKQALQTIINALVGLVISIVAAALVGFIAGRF
jgi:hypothetical protein